MYLQLELFRMNLQNKFPNRVKILIKYKLCKLY